MDLQHRLHPSQATLESGVLALELLDPWILCLRLPASLSQRHSHLGDLVTLATLSSFISDRVSSGENTFISREPGVSRLRVRRGALDRARDPLRHRNMSTTFGTLASCI